MPYPYSSEECRDLTNYIYLLEPSWGKIIYWMVVHGTNVERWKRSALNFAVYSTALTVTALCALQEQMKLFHGIVSKVEKVKSVSFLSGKKILRSGLLLCGILEEGLFGSNFPVILFLVEAARKTRHQIVTSLFQNKHNQQEENIFWKNVTFIHCHFWLCCKTWSFPVLKIAIFSWHITAPTINNGEFL